MYSKLPRELLEQIFTHPEITKKDLLQIQLACKQWSPVAQRHLYEVIDLEDGTFYASDRASHRGISESLTILPHLVYLFDVEHWSIADTDEGDLVELSLKLARKTLLKNKDKLYDDATLAKKRSSFTIKVHLSETQATFNQALETLKNKPIKSLTVKYLQGEMTEQTLNSIIGNYTTLQDLEFKFIRFPSGAPLSNALEAKQIRNLHLNRCEITKESFIKLSHQFKHLNRFKYKTDEEEVLHGERNNEKNKISIFLPHTAINMIDLNISGWIFYTVKI